MAYLTGRTALYFDLCGERKIGTPITIAHKPKSKEANAATRSWSTIQPCLSMDIRKINGGILEQFSTITRTKIPTPARVSKYVIHLLSFKPNRLLELKRVKG